MLSPPTFLHCLCLWAAVSPLGSQPGQDTKDSLFTVRPAAFSHGPVSAEYYITLYPHLRVPKLTSFPRSYIRRLCTFTAWPINEVGGIELALRGYTASQSGARVPISTVWNMLDFDLDPTASIINPVVDLLRTRRRIWGLRACSGRGIRSKSSAGASWPQTSSHRP
jgi:hypothetical protein